MNDKEKFIHELSLAAAMVQVQYNFVEVDHEPNDRKRENIADQLLENYEDNVKYYGIILKNRY